MGHSRAATLVNPWGEMSGAGGAGTQVLDDPPCIALSSRQPKCAYKSDGAIQAPAPPYIIEIPLRRCCPKSPSPNMPMVSAGSLERVMCRVRRQREQRVCFAACRTAVPAVSVEPCRQRTGVFHQRLTEPAL